MGESDQAIELYALRSALDGVLYELEQLGELWVELRAEGKPTKQVARAIAQATAESRRYEKRIKRLEHKESTDGREN